MNVLLCQPAIYFGNAIKHRTVCFTEKCLKWTSCLTWHSRSRPQNPPFLGHVVLNKLSRVALGRRMDNSILAVLRWRECRCCLVMFLANLPRWKFPALPRKKKFSFWPHKKSLFSVCHPGCPVWDNLVLSCFCERVVTRTKWTFTKNLNCFSPHSSLSLLIWDPWLVMMHRGLQLYELFCCYWYWVFIADLCAFVSNLFTNTMAYWLN